MGTNYYWYEKPRCDHCGREDKPVHIGKSSYGWCFLLHIDPTEEILSLADWQSQFNKPGSYIRNEYHDTVSVPEMLSLILERDQFAHHGILKHHGHGAVPGGQTYDLVDGEFS